MELQKMLEFGERLFRQKKAIRRSFIPFMNRKLDASGRRIRIWDSGAKQTW